MKAIKTETSVNGKVVELMMVTTPLNLEYYYIYVNDELVHSQYDNNNKLHVIFSECVNEDFDLIFA